MDTCIPKCKLDGIVVKLAIIAFQVLISCITSLDRRILQEKKCNTSQQQHPIWINLVPTSTAMIGKQTEAEI